MKVSNRRALLERNLQFEALAAYANMGDSPEDWRKFRRKNPRFFWDESLYENAEVWLAQTLPPNLPYTTTRLLLHRDHLRRVWAGIDRKGESLSILYGFEKKLNPVEPTNAEFGVPHQRHPLLLDFRALTDREETRGMMPEGEPIVNGVSGEIVWHFRSEFQQTLFELMRIRWRAKICTQCGKYFVADKTAQTYCSTNCAEDSHRARQNDYWRRLGNENRKARKEKAEVK